MRCDPQICVSYLEIARTVYVEVDRHPPRHMRQVSGRGANRLCFIQAIGLHIAVIFWRLPQVEKLTQSGQNSRDQES